MILGAVEFPPIENVIEWPAWLFEGSDLFAFNKIAFIHFLSVLLPALLFLFAARGDSDAMTALVGNPLVTSPTKPSR